jgi:hypothetical protein
MGARLLERVRIDVSPNRDFQTNRAPGFSSSSSKLLTKSALRLSQSLLARDLVTSTISCTRTRHGLLNGLSRLRRYFAHPFLNGSHRARRRLSTHPGHRTGRSRRPSGSFCFDLGVDLCLHATDLVPTRAGITRR